MHLFGSALDLVHAGNSQAVIAHRPHHSCHKGAMPILVLYIPILAPIDKVRTVDVIYNACMASTPQS